MPYIVLHMISVTPGHLSQQTFDHLGGQLWKVIGPRPVVEEAVQRGGAASRDRQPIEAVPTTGCWRVTRESQLS